MISVVMASYLGDYPGAATNRIEKFHRAVQSFVDQGIGELIIVADGCAETAEQSKRWLTHDNVHLVKIPKQPLFSGKVRQAGIETAAYDWVCYLDTDDQFGRGHLLAIADHLNAGSDWLYWDDYLGDERRNCVVSMCRIGTSCIAHKKSLCAVWPDGYMHDWRFIEQLGPNYKKIDGTKYIVNHVPGKLDI